MRNVFAWALARVDLGTAGQPVKAAMPVINWRGADQYVLAEILHAYGAPVADDELVATLTPPIIKKLAAVVTGRNGIALRAMLAALADEKVAHKVVVLFADAPCRSVESVYLKLLAMSEGLTPPHTLNLTGIFGLLPNLAWSGHTPYELDWLRENKIELQILGRYPAIDYVDKFPRFLHHVIPADNTRILDGGKVRLGAHLAAGTTVMPGASYINFNAGTLGPSMVEGRISSSATVGSRTDVGGGASILGTLSGGNATPIAVGKDCLLGANAVCGIPLGDGCIIDAGVAVLAGSKVRIAAAEQAKLLTINRPEIFDGEREIFKGSELSGGNGLHFRVDSSCGALTAFRSKHKVVLNAVLHD